MIKSNKSLQDLTLLDRFLFSEAVEDADFLQNLLEIILGKEIILRGIPQSEKEQKHSPLQRYIRLDVWAEDKENKVYDTEVQKKDTKNLPKRSRYYQGVIDSRLLQPGDPDFNKLKDVYIIIIAPFDLFGKGRYQYTFGAYCDEDTSVKLKDGATRIFLNTHGKNQEEVSPELIELLNYMEHTNKNMELKSPKVRKMKEHVEEIKGSGEIEVRYMQAWEERALDRMEAKEEARREMMHILVETYEEMGLSNEEIQRRIRKRFEVSENEAAEYVNKHL